MTTTTPNPPQPLFGMSLAELTTLVGSLGHKPYRARQIFEALYRQRVSSVDEITVLPAALRHELTSTGHTVGLPEIVQTARSVDGTERYLVRLADGETVETVWMPGRRRRRARRRHARPRRRRGTRR